MPYTSLTESSKNDFNTLISTFWLINDTLNDLSFSIDLGEAIDKGSLADFETRYVLSTKSAEGLLAIGLREPAGFSISFKLEDIEGYYFNKTEETPLDFKIYFKNNILLWVLKDKYQKRSTISITTKSAGFMYDSWKKEQ